MKRNRKRIIYETITSFDKAFYKAFNYAVYIGCITLILLVIPFVAPIFQLFFAFMLASPILGFIGLFAGGMFLFLVFGLIVAYFKA